MNAPVRFYRCERVGCRKLDTRTHWGHCVHCGHNSLVEIEARPEQRRAA